LLLRSTLANSFVGRRLYIGNLAYATTEGELKTFFKEFLVYVISSLYTHRNKVTNVSPANLSQSRSTREPLARLDMPSSISQLRPRLNVPSPNSTVRLFSIGKFPSSLHESRKHTARALQAVVKAMAIPTVDVHPSEAVAVVGDVVAGLFAAAVVLYAHSMRTHLKILLTCDSQESRLMELPPKRPLKHQRMYLVKSIL